MRMGASQACQDFCGEHRLSSSLRLRLTGQQIGRLRKACSPLVAAHVFVDQLSVIQKHYKPPNSIIGVIPISQVHSHLHRHATAKSTFLTNTAKARKGLTHLQRPPQQRRHLPHHSGEVPGHQLLSPLHQCMLQQQRPQPQGPAQHPLAGIVPRQGVGLGRGGLGTTAGLTCGLLGAAAAGLVRKLQG